MITVITATLDGKEIVYTNKTIFRVQLGKGSKGKYEDKYRFEGDLGRAVSHYNALNVGNGYKKRLLMEGAMNPVLAKQTS